MSRATALGAPLNLSCHPERSEGSLSQRVRPFPFAEFTLERSEGLRAAAHALRVTSDGRPPESVALFSCARPAGHASLYSHPATRRLPAQATLALALLARPPKDRKNTARLLATCKNNASPALIVELTFPPSYCNVFAM